MIFKECAPGYDDPVEQCQFGSDMRGERYCHVHHDYQGCPPDSGHCPHATALHAARRRGEYTVARCACTDPKETP